MEKRKMFKMTLFKAFAEYEIKTALLNFRIRKHRAKYDKYKKLAKKFGG